MPKVYDDWERLVVAALRKEELWQLFHAHSRTTSSCSTTSGESASPILDLPPESSITTISFSPSRSASLELNNGDLYIGTFSNNIPHGSGKYLWKDGCMYEGEWKRGRASGKGKFSWPSGATFEGEFKSGRMDGVGTFIGSGGEIYRGSWSRDRKHGYDVKHYSNGDYYEGPWKRNFQDGQGRYAWSNGNEYIGEWKTGVIHGRGVLVWKNGNKYDGNWENGVPNGNGVFTWPDGSCCTGCWSSDSPKNRKILNGTFHAALISKNEEESKGYFGHKLSAPLMVERAFPRICIWESDGEAGDITSAFGSMGLDSMAFPIDSVFSKTTH